MILLRTIPFLSPVSRTWGFNHLIFLPGQFAVAFSIIAVLALALPFTKLAERWGDKTAEWFSEFFFVSRLKYVNRFIFVIFMTVLFTIFAAPTHFLGDGYAVIKNLVSDSGVLFKWSEIGIIRFMRLIRVLIGPPDESTSRLTFQIVSVLSGAVVVYFFFLISNIAADNDIRKFFLFTLSFFSGSLLLFFGYPEYYPIVWVFMVAFVYYCLHYQKTGKRLYVAILILIAGIIIHMQMAIFVPAAIYVSLSRGRGLFLYRRFKVFILGLISGLAATVCIVLIYKYNTEIYVEQIFLPLLGGKPIDPDYAIFSLSHLTDILNEVILLSPFLIFLIILNGKSVSKIFADRTKFFLGLASIGSLLFLFVIDPQLAMPRDWDLFSTSAFTMTLLFVLSFPDSRINILKRLLVSMLIILIISPVPFLLTNLNRDRSIKYIEYLIELDKEKGVSSLVVLTDYFKQRGDSAIADSLNGVFNRQYPLLSKYNQAMGLLAKGAIRDAYSVIRTIKPNRFDGDYQGLMARFYSLQGENIKALEYINNAIQLRRYNSEYYAERAWIYIGMNDYDQAYDDFRHGYSLNNSSLFVMEGMVFLFDKEKKYDSSAYYAQKMITIDSTQAIPYYFLGKAAIAGRRFQLAREYINSSLEFAGDDSALIKQLNDLEAIIEKYENNKANK